MQVTDRRGTTLYALEGSEPPVEQFGIGPTSDGTLVEQVLAVHEGVGSVVVEFRPGGRQLVYRPANTGEPSKRLTQVSRLERECAKAWFSRDGKTLSWETPSSPNRSFMRLSTGEVIEASRFETSPSGRYVVSREGDDKGLLLKNTATGESLTLPIPSSGADFELEVSERYVVAYSQSLCAVYSTDSGEPVELNTGLLQGCRRAAIHDGSNLIAFGGADGRLAVFSASIGALVVDKQSHKGPISAVAFSPCGRRIATCSSENVMHVWLSHELPVIASAGQMHDFVVDREGERIFLAGNTLGIVSTETGQNLGRPSRDPQQGVRSVAIVPTTRGDWLLVVRTDR